MHFKRAIKLLLVLCVLLSLSLNAFASPFSAALREGFMAAAENARADYDLNTAVSDMRIERTKLFEYRIYMGDGHSYVTMTQKSWGVWNIDAWITTLGGYDTLMAGGGTDWEYVFRVSDNRAGLVFSGGNHGNEALVSIDFFDDTTNASLGEILPGRSFSVGRLRVEEKTRLSIGSGENREYATMKRVYTFSDKKIILETSMTFLRDVSMATSYTCMFPISKQFGRFCSFDDANLTVETQDGTSSPSEDYLGKVASSTCTLWGNDNRYRFRVHIYDTAVMTDNWSSDLKTFLWNILPHQTKLYFTKYEQNKGFLVRGGEVWNMKSSWELLPQ